MVAVTQEEHPLRMTEAEYLNLESQSEIRHEYLNGEVFAMAGASWEHNRISMSTSSSLYVQLQGKSCLVNPSDQRIKVTATGLFTYPDISVVCGDPKFAGNIFDTIVNPIVIIEILSKSTEAYDRGEKFQHYREIETLQDYILISQTKPHIEGYTKQKNSKWLFSDAVGLDAIFDIASIDCKLALADVYVHVTFPKKDSKQEPDSEHETS
ncbi:MAG: Uma2 family endonuclease [Anaerolineae bacterium]|nr:Uma2 family endonuclease [Anaerolineae bacterium]